MKLIRTNTMYGFTLVELVVVITIIALLSIFVAPRFFNTLSYKNRQATDQVLSALHYSQQLAMNRGGDIQLILTSANFSVQISGGGNIPSPDGQAYPKKFPNGITAVAETVYFNALGQPINISGSPLINNILLNIGSSTITVEANTGYAH